MSLRWEPDLVSKLREVVARWRDMSKGETYRDGVIEFCAAELESLLGREGQAAPLSSRADELNQCLQIIVTQAGNILDDLHAMKGAGVGSEIPDAVRAIEAAVKRASKVTWRVLEQPSPSTPIVPGTAGLSAEQVQKVFNALEEWDPEIFWNNMAQDLNALLGAEPGVPLIHGRAELDIHDARIRKSVLEEAAQLLKYYGYSANLVDEIRALAERPAPAGEAEAPGPKLKCRCQPIHSTECVFRDARSSQYRHFYPHELGRGEVKGEK